MFIGDSVDLRKGRFLKFKLGIKWIREVSFVGSFLFLRSAEEFR